MSYVVPLENYRPPSRSDEIAWTQARIEEADSASGLYTAIDTIDLDPVDANPALPQLRDLTTNQGTALAQWYRVVFLDDDDNESQPSAAIQNLEPSTPAGGFCAPSDLAVRLGLDFTADEDSRAAALLTDASGVIRDETSQTIDLVTDDEYERPGTSDQRIVLPQRPVVSVASVSIDGTEISDWYLVGNELVRGTGTLLSPDGLETGSRGFGSETQTLTIVYTHGYATIPQTLKTIALEMAVRVFVNPGSLIQEGIAGTQSTFAPYSDPPRGLMLTNSEKAALRRMFGRRARSITVAGG